jgi:dGTPase
MVHNVVEGLFDALRLAMADPEKLAASDNRVYRSFLEYLHDHESPADLDGRQEQVRPADLDRRREQVRLSGQPDLQRIVDYIAGMSDSFATKCFEDIYWF